MSKIPDTETLKRLLANATPGEWEEITPEGGIWPPRVFSGSTIVSMVDNSDMTHGEKVTNARLIALAPTLAARLIAIEAAIYEATHPDFIWGALDNVHDGDTTLGDYAAAVSRAIRAALEDGE